MSELAVLESNGLMGEYRRFDQRRATSDGLDALSDWLEENGCPKLASRIRANANQKRYIAGKLAMKETMPINQANPFNKGSLAFWGFEHRRSELILSRDLKRAIANGVK